MILAEDQARARLGVRVSASTPTARSLLRISRQWFTCEVFDSSLISRTVFPADGSVWQVPAGDIRVSVAAPSGEVCSRVVTLSPHERYILHVILEPRELRAASVQMASAEQDTDIDHLASARILRQLGYRNIVPEEPRSIRARATSPRLTEGLYVIQHVDAAGHVVSAFLPPMRCDRDTTLTPDFAGRHVALAAMHYLRAGDMWGAEAVCDGILRSGHDHNDSQESVDPVTVIVRSYVALRHTKNELVSNMSLSAPEQWPWFPDTYIIAAEYFARAGFHITALNHLRQLLSAGLPLFTEGYTMALTRLSSYASSMDDEWRETDQRRASLLAYAAQSLSSWDFAEARAIHRDLLVWARYMDLDSTTLTLVGAQLNAAADAPLRRPIIRKLRSVQRSATAVSNESGLAIGHALTRALRRILPIDNRYHESPGEKNA